MKLNKNAIIYSAMLLAMSNAGLQLLGFVFRIFLSRMITAESMGVYQLIFPFYSVIMAITLSGICVSVSRLTAEKYALGDTAGVRKVVEICIFIFVTLFAAVAVGTVAFNDFIASRILGDERTHKAIIILLPTLFLTGLENIYKACFYGIKRVYPPIISELSEQVIRISAVVLLLYIFKPQTPTIAVFLIVIGMGISEVSSATLLTIMYRKHLPRDKSDGRSLKERITDTYSPTIIKDILVITLPVTIAGLLQNILSSVNTVLLPRRLVVSGMAQKQATETFGILFGMTMPLLMLPAIFIGALATIILPRLSESMALGHLDRVRDRISKSIYVTGLLTLPVFAIVVPLGEPLCDLLYRQPAADDYLMPLAIASVFIYYQIITGSALNALGMQKRAGIHIVIGGIIQLTFTYLAVSNPMFGIYGYIFGYGLSGCIVMVLNMQVLISKTNLKILWYEWFLSPLLNAVFVGLLASILHAIAEDLGFHDPVSILCAAGLAGFVYLFMLKWQGVDAAGYVARRL